MSKSSFLILFLASTLLWSQSPQLPYPIIFVHGICSNSRIWTEGENNMKTFLESKGLRFGGNLNITLDYQRNNPAAPDTKENDVHLFTTNINIGDFYTVNFATHASGYSNTNNPDYPYDPYYNTAILLPNETNIPIFAIRPGEYFIGDILRIENEFLQVISVGTTSISVTRGQFGTLPSTHFLTNLWNLSSMSNQASIAKQGWGLKKAIEAVKAATGASKVILVGHSMGGLSIRQYIQSVYYQEDIAKVVTIGTPHLGAKSDEVNNWFTAQPKLDNRQAGMRDLRYNYGWLIGNAPSPPYGDPPDDGIFLFGGNEGESLTQFYETDFNANGQIDIIPINGMSNHVSNLPTSINYCWAVSNLSGTGGDIAVRADRQYPWDEMGTIGDTVNTNKIHQDEPNDIYTLIRALDEPGNYSSNYNIYFDKTYLGFITHRTNYNFGDFDYYKVTLQQSGTLKFTFTGSLSGIDTYILSDGSGNAITYGSLNSLPFTFSRELPAGSYGITLVGHASSTTWQNPYTITPNFVPAPQSLSFDNVKLDKTSYSPSSSATLTVTLSNQLTGANVSFILDGTTHTCSEIGNGVYNKSFPVPNNSGTYPISISASKTGYISCNSQINLIVNPAGNSSLTLSADPGSIPFNGVSSSTIYATVKNSTGQLLSGVEVQFTPPMTGPGGSCTPGTATTNSSGVATSVYSPSGIGLAAIQVQTNNNLNGSVNVDVYSAGSNTYTIKMTSRIISQTATNVVYELNPYVTLTASGACVDAIICTVQTDIGTFQNGTQAIANILGNGGYGCGRMEQLPLLTFTQSGTAKINIKVGPTSQMYNLTVMVGLLPNVQSFLTIPVSGPVGLDVTEPNIRWSPDGKYLASMPGKLFKVPSFTELYSTPNWTQTVSFSKTGKNIIFGRNTDNPVWYTYNTEQQQQTEVGNPSSTRIYSLSWWDQSDEKDFVMSNGFTGLRNQIKFYTGGTNRFINTTVTDKYITSIEWSGDYLAVVQDYDIYLYNTTSLQQLWKYSLGRANKSTAAFSPDRSKLAVIGRSYTGYNCLFVFNVNNQTPIYEYTLSVNNNTYYSLSWSPDGSKLVCSGNNGFLKIVDYTTGIEEYNLVASGPIYGVSWGKNNLIAACSNSSIFLYAPFDNDGPSISVKYPSAGFRTIHDTVNISGFVNDLIGLSSAEFSLDGTNFSQLAITNDTCFSQLINLTQAETLIRLRATDRGGRTTEQMITILRTMVPSQPVLAAPANNTTGVSSTVNLEWFRTPNASSYNLQLALDYSFTQLIFNDFVFDTMKTFTDLATLTTYYWRVSSKNLAGQSNYSEIWKFTTSVPIPQTPFLVEPSNNSINQLVNVYCKWKKVEFADRYHIQVSKNMNFTNIIFNDSTILDSMHHMTNLDYLTKYYWRTRAINQAGISSWSFAYSFTTIIKAPETPQLSEPTNDITNLLLPITFNWFKSPTADLYRLQLSTDSAFVSVVLDNAILDTSKIFGDLTSFTKYFWRILSSNSGGSSAWSTIWNFKTLGNPYSSSLITPNNNTVSQPINGLVFKWTKPEERIETILKYQYQLSTDSLFGNFVVDDTTLTDTTTTINGLNYLTNYYWRVRATNEMDWGDWSEVWKTTTIIEKPTVPVLALPINDSKGLLNPITSKWNTSLRVEKYILQLSTDNQFANLVVNDSTLTDTTRLLPPLSDYTQYYWRVKAVNVGGESNWSEIWNFKTLGNPYSSSLVTPNNNTVSQPINGLVFKWSKAKERIETIQRYQYQLSTDSLFNFLVLNDTTLSDTVKTVDGLTYLTSYYWRVRANNETGWGDWSEVWKTTTIIEKPTVPVLALPINDSKGIILPVTAKWLKVLRGQKYILQISLNSNFTSHAFIDSSVTDTSKLLSGLNDYTQYYWRIKAVNIGGESGWSEVWNFKTLGSSFTVELVIPDNQSIYQPVNGLTFKWKKPLERIETILKYQYQLSSDSLFGSYTVNDTTLTDTIKTVNNLNYLTKYFWRVRAGNETGWGDWSSVWQTTTIIEKPATPILALPLNNATKLLNLVTLKWNKTPRAEKYRLEVSEFANFSTHLLIDSTFTDTVKVLPQLEFTKTYYWRVRASNIGGTSEFSAIWNFRTLGLPLVVEPLLPSNNSVNQPMNNLQFVWKRGGEQTLMLNAKPIKGIPNKGSKLISEDQNDEFISQIQKSGHSKSGNDGILAGNPESILNYWLEVTPDTNSNNYLYKDSTLTDTTKIISGFNYYTNYYWRLKARNENGWSDFTSWFKFRTIIERPSKPILASPVNNSVGLIQPITLTWNNSIRAENYTLQVSKDQSFTNVVYTDTTLADTIKALPELEKLTNHFWRVFAKNIGGISDTSEVWTFKTLGVPTTVILISPENNAQNIQTGVNFKWSRANNQELAIKYWIEVGTDTIGTVVAIDSMLTDTTKFIQLENDKNYYWRVRAENEAGWGNFTNWSNFRTIVPLPSIPVLVSPVNNTVWVRINPQMVWNKTTYTEKYHLQIAADSLFTGIIINDSTITDTLKQVDTLQYKTTYYWRVRSINVAGYSNYSTVWDFRTQIKSIIAPTGLQATASIPGKVDLSWIDNSVNELGFAIVRKEGDSTSSNQLTYIDTVSMNIVSFTDTTVIDSVKYSYLVGAFNLDTVSAQSNYATVTTLTGIKEIFAGLIPTEYLIEQNYPNPFNPSTTLRYGLPFESEVKIEMYDITGQRVTSLVNESQKAGYYELSFKIDGLSSGIYFYIIDAKEIGGTGNFRKVKKMILMK